jgi:hypothetical protein
MRSNDIEIVQRGAVETHPRKNSNDVWLGSNRRVIREQRNFRESISFRVCASWLGIVRYLHCAVGRQKQERVGVAMKMYLFSSFREPIKVSIECRSKLRKWAYDNAYTLVFMSVLFAITWIAMLAYGVTHAGQ